MKKKFKDRPDFYSLRYSHDIVSRYSEKKKRLSKEQEVEKNLKIKIFPKGLVYGFGENLQFFHRLI